jgi:hypothetical protein
MGAVSEVLYGNPMPNDINVSSGENSCNPIYQKKPINFEISVICTS